MAYLAACSEAWVISAKGQPNIECPGVLSAIDLSTVLTTFSMQDVDPATAATVFGSGFILVGTFYAAGFALGQLLRAVRGHFH